MLTKDQIEEMVQSAYLEGASDFAGSDTSNEDLIAAWECSSAHSNLMEAK